MAIKLGHVIRRGGSSTSGGIGGQLRGDAVGIRFKVGGAKGVTTIGGSTEFPLHFTMEGDKIGFTSRPILGRGDETIPTREVIGK